MISTINEEDSLMSYLCPWLLLGMRSSTTRRWK